MPAMLVSSSKSCGEERQKEIRWDKCQRRYSTSGLFIRSVHLHVDSAMTLLPFISRGPWTSFCCYSFCSSFLLLSFWVGYLYPSTSA